MEADQMNNPNTNRPWDSASDWYWENPDNQFYGMTNPKASHNRVLFVPMKTIDRVLVCYVNVQEFKPTMHYVNRKKVATAEYARTIWESLVNTDWYRDDSIPPSLVDPKAEDSGWGEIWKEFNPEEINSSIAKMQTGYALTSTGGRKRK
tara:strand:+ start:266 stop:712 length:447 start_codon:yes stop_codon:yes gene_type:complete